jgi:hypothetical protein
MFLTLSTEVFLTFAPALKRRLQLTVQAARRGVEGVMISGILTPASWTVRAAGGVMWTWTVAPLARLRIVLSSTSALGIVSS